MKIKFLSMCLLVASIFTLVGCVNKISPESTLKSAGKAILERKLEDFRETLAPQLRDLMGNTEQMENVRSRLVQYTSLSLAEKTLLDTRYGDRNIYRTYSLKIFGVNAEGENESIYTAKVLCDTYESPSSHAGPECSLLPDGEASCVSEIMNSPVRTTSCEIIEFAVINEK